MQASAHRAARVSIIHRRFLKDVVICSQVSVRNKVVGEAA